jgi:Uma2 family endonuclease
MASSLELLKRRFTIEEYHRMAEVGILGEDDSVELLDGEIVRWTPIGSRHAACVKRLNRLFGRLLAQRAVVSVQDPVRLGLDSEPQPDVALLHPRADFYATAHPGAGDVFLVVEIADTSAELERTVKVALYARAEVREVWVVDLARDRIEVFRRPTPGGYRDVQTLGRDDRLAPDAFPDASLEAREVLGGR